MPTRATKLFVLIPSAHRDQSCPCGWQQDNLLELESVLMLCITHGYVSSKREWQAKLVANGKHAKSATDAVAKGAGQIWWRQARQRFRTSGPRMGKVDRFGDHG